MGSGAGRRHGGTNEKVTKKCGGSYHGNDSGAPAQRKGDTKPHRVPVHPGRGATSCRRRQGFDVVSDCLPDGGDDSFRPSDEVPKRSAARRPHDRERLERRGRRCAHAFPPDRPGGGEDGSVSVSVSFCSDRIDPAPRRILRPSPEGGRTSARGGPMSSGDSPLAPTMSRPPPPRRLVAPPASPRIASLPPRPTPRRGHRLRARRSAASSRRPARDCPISGYDRRGTSRAHAHVSTGRDPSSCLSPAPTALRSDPVLRDGGA